MIPAAKAIPVTQPNDECTRMENLFFRFPGLSPEALFEQSPKILPTALPDVFEIQTAGTDDEPIFHENTIFS